MKPVTCDFVSRVRQLSLSVVLMLLGHGGHAAIFNMVGPAAEM